MTTSRTLSTIVSIATALAAAACSPAHDADLVVAESGGSVEPAVAAAGDSAIGQGKAALHLIVATGRNETRYRVRERLMVKDFDNDAIGVTGNVTGGIAVDSAGRLIAGPSRFVVRIDSLKSDSDRRDGYVRRRVLEAEQHPAVTFVPTGISGISPSAVVAKTANTWTFQLVGDLTVKGVTRPTTWQVTARREGAGVVGTATTAFTFADFSMTQPKVPIVLSVADTIKLEYDFTLAPPR